MKLIFNTYRLAWQCLLLNWRIVLLLYGVGLAFSFIAMGPISNLLESVFGGRLMLNDMISSFDYTSIVDMLNHHGTSVSISIKVIMSFLVIYLIWSVFYSGGIVELSCNRYARSSTLEFWRGGAQYFFRYLRLSIYIILFLGILALLFGTYFTKDGLNPLQLESETFLIIRFKVLLFLLIVVLFFKSIFRDIAKVVIKHLDHHPFMFKANMISLTKTFSVSFIALSLVNLVFLGLGLLLYMLLKLVLSSLVVAIIISQIFFIYRIAYRFVRLASFNYLYTDTKAVPGLHT